MESLLLNGSILVVDDDVSIANFLKDYLEALGCRVVCVKDGQEALNITKKTAPAFVILDLMMPFVDGYAVCEEIRKISQVPILMLTAKMEEEDKIRGLYTGADDYLTKPFSPRELVARMQAILRRTEDKRISASHLLQISHLSYDSEKHSFQWKGKPIYLTLQEAKVLQMLMEAAYRVCTREQLLDILYPAGDKYVTDRIIDVHIGNIRQKIRAVDERFDLIETVRGIGYRLKEE